MCMRDWQQGRTAPKGLGNGLARVRGARKGCLRPKGGPWPIDEIV